MPRSREVQVAVGSVVRLTGRRFPELEKALEAAPLAAQVEFLRLVNHLDVVISHEKRKALTPWIR